MWIGEFGVGAVAIQLQRAAESCEVLGRPCMFAVSPTSRAPSGGPAWRTAARCSRGCAAPDEQRIAAHKAAPCVSTAATGPSRNLFVDGGQPTGKKKSTDNLNVFYTGQKPKIIHSTATQNPDAGLVTLDYGTARFVVNYDDIEQVVIRKN
jgi:hypothetical protein